MQYMLYIIFLLQLTALQSHLGWEKMRPIETDVKRGWQEIETNYVRSRVRRRKEARAKRCLWQKLRESDNSMRTSKRHGEDTGREKGFRQSSVSLINDCRQQRLDSNMSITWTRSSPPEQLKCWQNENQAMSLDLCSVRAMFFFHFGFLYLCHWIVSLFWSHHFTLSDPTCWGGGVEDGKLIFHGEYLQRFGTWRCSSEITATRWRLQVENGCCECEAQYEQHCFCSKSKLQLYKMLQQGLVFTNTILGLI